MWAMILAILKIIGILLLAVFLIFLVLLLLVLFYPLSYKIIAHKDPEEYQITAKASWCFHLVGISAVYPKPGVIILRLLGIPLWDSRKAKVKKESGNSDSGVSSVEQVTEEDAAPKQPDIITTTKYSESTPGAKNSPDDRNEQTPPKEVFGGEEAVKPDATEKASGETNEKSTENSKDKPGLWQRIKGYYKEFLFYKDFWQAEETQALLGKSLGKLKAILKSVLPQKIEADVLFGTGSPDTTGYGMAVYGILLPYLGPKVNVTPDFEEQILQGRLKAKGHICVFTIIRHVLSVLLDKNLKILNRRFKKHKAKQQKALQASGK